MSTRCSSASSTQLAADYTAQAELLDRLYIAIEESKTKFLTYRSQRATEPDSIECYPVRLVDSRDHGEDCTWRRLHRNQCSDVSDGMCD